MGTGRIEKQVLLRAPLSRVWRAQTFAGNEGGWTQVTGLIAEYLKRAQ